MFGGVIQTVKDMLFPVFCLGCKREGVWVCAACLADIDRSGVALCPVCHEEQPYGMCCTECQQYSYLDGHLAGVVYEHRTLAARMIESLKYQYVTDMVDGLFGCLEPLLVSNRHLFAHIDAVVPIPLHDRRYAERGFNQAALIASVVAQYIDAPMRDILVRSRYTMQQARLEKEEREVNLKDAFRLRLEDRVDGKNILLVDDVFTTGSTMQAAAKTLRKSGASSVVGLSVARG